MNHEVGAGEKFDVALILTMNAWQLSGVAHIAVMRRVRLVIRGVDDADTTAFQPVTQREPGMVQITGRHSNSAELKRSFDKFVVADYGAELPQRDREILVLHLTGESILQSLSQALRRVDVPFVPRNKERREKGNPWM